MMEYVSFMDIFKVCIGPSSSHTLGPWLAAKHFMETLISKFDNNQDQANYPYQIDVKLLGSLAKTGVGHQTALGISLGLIQEDPGTIAAKSIQPKIAKLKESSAILFKNNQCLKFHPQMSIEFNFKEQTPVHPNTLVLMAKNKDGKIVHQQEYYSIGGGEVLLAEPVIEQSQPSTDITHSKTNSPTQLSGDQQNNITIDPKSRLNQLQSIRAGNQKKRSFPYPITHGSQLIQHTKQLKCSISEVVLINEKSWLSEHEITEEIAKIAWTMVECIQYGLFSKEITLPGGLGVRRRASNMAKQLLATEPESVKKAIEDLFATGAEVDPRTFLKAMRQLTLPEQKNTNRWLSAFALAVNEQNAAFGRVVTAPTNGAAGVIPAVFMYYLCFENKNAGELEIQKFFLCASEVASLFKKGATLSAAMGGCQAEIGVSSAMAAAALTELSGGTAAQSLAAAEIAMEHHLGLTCDPISGLVQVPCIERNAMGAAKAITASHLALMSDPSQLIVNIDDIIKTMWQTALDMKNSYKETSEAGLAKNVSVALSEC
ncbi:L-serine dehydratase [Spirochaetota bacterium]|nr:L-serine dehydratase [Spirochaetota bacterium]